MKFEHPTLQRQAFEKAERMPDDRTGRPDLAEMLRFAEEPDVLDGVRQMCARVGVEVADDDMREMADARARARSLQQYAASNLRAGKLTREQYYEQVRSTVASFAVHNKKILGEPRFYAIFGEAADEPYGLIDKQTFLSSVDAVDAGSAIFYRLVG